MHFHSRRKGERSSFSLCRTHRYFALELLHNALAYHESQPDALLIELFVIFKLAENCKEFLQTFRPDANPRVFHFNLQKDTPNIFEFLYNRAVVILEWRAFITLDLNLYETFLGEFQRV